MCNATEITIGEYEEAISTCTRRDEYYCELCLQAQKLADKAEYCRWCIHGENWVRKGATSMGNTWDPCCAQEKSYQATEKNYTCPQQRNAVYRKRIGVLKRKLAAFIKRYPQYT